jgi:phospholipid/cholesterol/gamma-HCH transport system substrate-binding protein
MSRIARLGAFIVVTLAILIAGIFVIGNKQYLFSSTYRLNAQFDNVAGLAAGADVQVGGVHSGTVVRIALPEKPGQKVTVVLELAQSTHAIVKRDSVATIETQGLLGSQYVAVSFGSPGQAEVRDGETIASLPPLQMSELLSKTSGILDSSQQAIQNATLATAHLNSVSAKIDDGQGTVGALVNDKGMYDNMAQTTDALRATMTQAQAGVTDFKENMEALKHNFLLSGYFKKRGYEDSADLAENEIAALPQGAALKTFTYSAQQLFDKKETAALKNQKSLNAGGEFLAQNDFGFAVVVVSTGVEGDAQQDLVLTQARAMVIRAYLVEHFGFDDNQLKTLGLGKQTGTSPEGGWGTIQLLIYPTGAGIPENQQVPAAILLKTDSAPAAQASAGPAPKPE